MRTACSFAVCLALVAPLSLMGCDLDFQARKDLPPGLARRIEQKRAEVERQPGNAQLALELGELYLEGERWFEAADALAKARGRSEGSEARVMGGLAIAYMSLGYYDQVERLLRDCFQKNRQEPGCLYAAGELMMLVGSQEALEAARNVWSNFVAVAPDHQKAPYVRSALDQLNAQLGPPGSRPPSKAGSQPAGAASQPAASATGGPPKGGLPEGHPPTAPSAGSSAAPSAGPSAAPPAGSVAASSGSAANVDPTVPGHAAASGDADVGELNPFGAAIQKAMAAVRKNDAAGAEEAYKEALTIRPEDPSALAGLAEAQFAQRRLDDAVKSVEKAWAKDPKDAQVRWVFGLVMINARKRTAEAIAAWEALARDTPQYATQLDLDKRIETAKKFMSP